MNMDILKDISFFILRRMHQFWLQLIYVNVCGIISLKPGPGDINLEKIYINYHPNFSKLVSDNWWMYEAFFNNLICVAS